MLNISDLFGRSPFTPIHTHMNKVLDCVKPLTDLFEALAEGNLERVEKIAKEISKLEHLADLTKNDVRNHLPKSLFLPVDRGALLEILGILENAEFTTETSKLARSQVVQEAATSMIAQANNISKFMMSFLNMFK